MEMKNILGWIGIFVISFIPIILWATLGPGLYSLGYGDITHALGQISALVGMTMFALTFLLSTRNKFIENIFGGLDKVYGVHRTLGSIALVLIMFHPILLVVKFIPSDLRLAAIYILPSEFIAVNFGIIALLGLISLIFLTFYIRIKYQYWKLSHKLLGVVFIFAILHIFLIRNVGSRDYIFAGYYIYAGVVSIIGLSGFLYTLALMKNMAKKADYRIESIKVYHKDYYEIILNPEGHGLKYKSGQFGFYSFINDKLSKEPHPFSFASKTNSKKIKVVIKNLGDYTTKLHNLKIGDRVIVEGPYGMFNSHDKHSDQVWIAGGVGITPFIGMAEDLDKDMKNNITLFYSVKDKREFIFIEEFLRIQRETGNRFRLIQWVSNDYGYLTLKEIKKYTGDLNNKDYYLCGPQALKDSIRKGLNSRRVTNDKIFEEDFNLK